ncbi:hypothetical protein KB206_01500 [Microvirga sp. STS02]|nr:hypothetical protein [Microvirga sp. STS02]MBR7207273.1 hypothetical protein [Microvirga sp. STS02]
MPAPAAPLLSFDLSRFRLAEAAFIQCLIDNGAADGGTATASHGLTRVLLEPGFEMEVKRIYYTLSLAAAGYDEAGAPSGATGQFQLRFVFEVENLEEYSTTSEEFEGSFPIRDLMIMLGGVAYSTARGLVLGKTAGTPLAGFALPLRSPQELFQQSLQELEARDEPAAPKKRASASAKPKSVTTKRKPAKD